MLINFLSEVSVSSYFILLLIGFVYIVIFGGLSLLRREGLSVRFAIEALVITGIVCGLSVLTGLSIHPVLLLLILYLVTMRVRLLVDIGTFFARRRNLTYAERIYQLAGRIWPDQAGSIILQVNRGTALLQAGKMDEAIAIFNRVLEKSGRGYLGVKYEVAAHYNLAVAYLRHGKEAQATIEFNAVLDTWPASEFARRAASALEQHRSSNAPSSKEK